MDLLENQHRCVKRAYAGTVLGVVMGSFAGVASAIQTHGFSKLTTVVARDVVLRNAVLSQAGQTVGMMTLWSGLFQTIKCIGEEQRLDEEVRYGVAFAGSVGPFLPLKAFRRQLPWVLVLTALDIYHTPRGGGGGK